MSKLKYHAAIPPVVGAAVFGGTALCSKPFPNLSQVFECALYGGLAFNIIETMVAYHFKTGSTSSVGYPRKLNSDLKHLLNRRSRIFVGLAAVMAFLSVLDKNTGPEPDPARVSETPMSTQDNPPGLMHA